MAKLNAFSIQRSGLLNTINGTGKFLKKIGLDPFKLDAAEIIEKAKKRAGFVGILSDAEANLHRMVDAINKESEPNAFARLATKQQFEKTLYGRYKVEQKLVQNPEICKAKIEQPVFIIGMPRTGTTILHALLHEDPAHRSPLAWECILPYPVPKAENYTNNDQINNVKKDFEQLFKLVPDFLNKHYMAADSPQECLSINAFDFNTFQTTTQYYIPSYMEWFENKADRLSTMQFHKRFLQYLQSGGVKGDRWLLKSPVHLMRLDEIFEVYPDARIITTHRAPDRIVSSVASLISSIRSLYSDAEDPVRTAHEQADTWSRYFNRYIESRKRLNKEDQFIDIKFEDFITDQVGSVKKIYERFNWPLSDEAVKNFHHFIEQNPKDKNGVHDHSLKDFGLNANEINKQFEPYIRFLENL